MNIYYLILAHRDPDQLVLLAQTLKSKNSYVYIHIDGYTDIDPFLQNNYLSSNCIFINNRVKIRWGGFSMVEATLHTLQNMKDNGLDDDDHVIVMSGQDFPIISPQKLREHLISYKNKSMIEYRIQPNDDRNILNRIIKYHFHDMIVPNWFDNLIKKTLSLFMVVPETRNQVFVYVWQRVVNFFLPIKRYLLNHYTLYRGSSWMILGGNHVNYILKFRATLVGKNFIKEFRNIAGPDEFFFQILLLNSPHKEEIINELPWYIDWKKGPGLPRILDQSDYKDIKNSHKRFARKFELQKSKELIQLLLTS